MLAAVGTGEGVAEEGDGSVRGRMVRVVDPRVGFRFGFVVTAKGYSSQRGFQVIVPVINRIACTGDEIEELDLNQWDVIPERQSWFEQRPMVEPLLETAAIVSLSEEWKKSRDPRRWLKRQIEVMDVAIDPATLAAVEAKIEERLRPSA